MIYQGHFWPFGFVFIRPFSNIFGHLVFFFFGPLDSALWTSSFFDGYFFPHCFGQVKLVARSCQCLPFCSLACFLNSNKQAVKHVNFPTEFSTSCWVKFQPCKPNILTGMSTQRGDFLGLISSYIQSSDSQPQLQGPKVPPNCTCYYRDHQILQ